MDFTALRYFAEAAQMGSIRQAAERIHVSPSAISRQIAKLEHDLGATLLERRSNGVRLTPAGELLSGQLRSTMQDLSRIRVQIDELKGLRRGQVSIYCIEGLVDSYLAFAIDRFNKKYPEITFNVHVSSTDGILEALIADEADIGITLNPADRLDISVHGGWAESLCAVVSVHHPLSRRRSISLAELAEFPAALPETSFGVRQIIDRALLKSRVRLKLQITTNSILAICAIIEQGSAYTLLPRFAFVRSSKKGALVAIPLKDKNIEQTQVKFAIHSSRQLPIAVREFLASLPTNYTE